MLEITDLTVRYADGPTVLDGTSLRVEPGEVYSLLGPNGAGKSTLIAAVLGFAPVSGGKIMVGGVDARTHPRKARERIAYLPESVALWDQFTAREHVRLFADLLEVEAEPEHVLKAAGLDPSAWDRRVAAFSKGMRQRLALALVTLRRPVLALLDEPTSGLDPGAAEALSARIRQLAAEGAAVLVVSHDLFRFAGVADRMGLLRDGRVAMEFPPDQFGEAIAAFSEGKKD